MLSLYAATVVILNGPSAAGKSSIQRALQKIMPQPYVALGVDSLFDGMCPDEYTLGEKPQGFDQKRIRWVELASQDGKPTMPLFIGPEGQKIVKGMIGTIKAYADVGNNLVVDYIQYDPAWTKQLKKALQKHRVIWVKVYISLEVLEDREKARGTSPVGHARSHYHTVYKGIDYHMSVNTETMSADECASLIKSKVLQIE